MTKDAAGVKAKGETRSKRNRMTEEEEEAEAEKLSNYSAVQVKELYHTINGSPCFFYHEEEIIKRCQELKEAFPDYEFLYSVKANPFKPIVKTIYKQGFGVDVCSIHEIDEVCGCGLKADQIYHSAPGKSIFVLRHALSSCEVIMDSVSDLKMANDFAKKMDKSFHVGLRVNPNYTMESKKGGIPSKFGIDEEQILEDHAFMSQFPQLIINGIHVHQQSQMLNEKTLAKFYKKSYKLAKKLSEFQGFDLKYINFGSGIGTVYNEEQDCPIKLKLLNELMMPIVLDNDREMRLKLIIETGRFITCNAGVFYAKVMDVKISRGKKYVILNSGFNGFMRPVLANLLEKVAGGANVPGMEPLYTCKHECKLSFFNVNEIEEYYHAREDLDAMNNSIELESNRTSESPMKEEITVMGNLCTAQDVIAEDIVVGHVDIGDIVAISNAGSYGYTMTPLLFSSNCIPIEYYVLGNGRIVRGEDQIRVY